MKILNEQKPPKAIKQKPRILSIGTAPAKASRWPSYKIKTWSFLVFNYTGRIRLENETFEMRPGVAMFTAPWIFKHHMPAEDSFHYFAQLEFDQDTDEKAYWLIDFENDYLKIIEDWREAISFHINDPQRAEIRIWDILQRMKECWNYSENKKNIHPALKKALLYIELNLSSSFGIPELAEHAGVSHCYLIRLFHAYSKSTVSQYIKKRRMQKARQQILNTSMPIKDIAAESGIPDLHHFNKSIKKEFGLAPRKLRDAANND